MKKWFKYFQTEDGSVESALVIVPLIALFLATLQIIAIVNFRNVDLTKTQSQASYQATWQQVKPNDLEIDLDSGSPYEKLRLLVVKFDRNLPQIFPGVSSLMGNKKLRSTGTSVIEESESCWGGYVLC